MTCEFCYQFIEYDRLSSSAIVSGIHAVIILRDGDNLNSDANRTVLVRLTPSRATLLLNFLRFHASPRFPRIFYEFAPILATVNVFF